MDWSERSVLVTGGSRGIGAALVRSLARAGARVGFTYARRSEDAEALCAELEDAPGKVYARACPSEDFAAVQETVAAMEERLGPLWGLVNNAGITRDRMFVALSHDDWRRVLDVDLDGAFHFCRAVAFGLAKRKAGRIVNVSSVSGIRGTKGQANYAAAKAGLLGLTRSLAAEFAQRSITVNAVAPGFIETEMLDELKPAVREGLLKRIPLGRLGSSEEVARSIQWLLSEEAAYVTGQTLVVDGGLSIAVGG